MICNTDIFQTSLVFYISYYKCFETMFFLYSLSSIYIFLVALLLVDLLLLVIFFKLVVFQIFKRYFDFMR